MQKTGVVTKTDLAHADLHVDCIYQGGRRGNAGDDPLPDLMGVSNSGGFRIIGKKGMPRLVVLKSNFSDPDWPDDIDRETGIFTYFGDNKEPGHELHSTKRYGNKLLQYMFEKAHGPKEARAQTPPVFVFAGTRSWRDVEFLGLAVPGAEKLGPASDLVALWKLRDEKRFQNYQAKFTILDAGVVTRAWIDDIKRGDPLSANCPSAWRLWVESDVYKPLKAPPARVHRTKVEQLPDDDAGTVLIRRIHAYFGDDAVRFEECAMKLAEMMIPGIVARDLTRPTRDGGRDAIGKYQIGEGRSAILVNFALEAKCYGLNNPVGVKEVSRLISRLRHRQFGILVTTSYLHYQAYQEIMEDEHPIVIVAARDIVRLLKASGISEHAALESWLSAF